MTHLTRRDALLVTAAVAAIAPTTHRAEAADPPDTILSVPQTNPVSDGSAIPVGVRIPATWWKGKVADVGTLTSVVVTLSRSVGTPESFGPFATFTLSNNALAGAKAKGDIEFSTRIKQVVEANKSPVDLKLRATVRINADPKDYDGGTQVLTVAHGECQPANVSLLRLSAQPTRVAADKDIDLKTVVPQPLPSKVGGPAPRRLKTVVCTFKANATAGAPVECARIDAIDDAHLADEVFMGFRIRPVASGLVDVQWSYDDQTVVRGSIGTTVAAT